MKLHGIKIDIFIQTVPWSKAPDTGECTPRTKDDVIKHLTSNVEAYLKEKLREEDARMLTVVGAPAVLSIE